MVPQGPTNLYCRAGLASSSKYAAISCLKVTTSSLTVCHLLASVTVSAFYAEHYNKKISFSAHVWTKSKFLGLSIGVHNIGQGTVTLCDLNEEYIVTFPNGYGR